jgi:hypothetical protein
MIAHNVIITGSLKTPQYSVDPRGIGAWSIGGAVITNRRDGTGAGTQNAALLIGGQVGNLGTPSTTVCACTEEYNGTAWSVGGALNVSRSCAAGAGTQNDAFLAGGITIASARGTITITSEEYDGTVWVNGGNLTTSKCAFGGAGTSNAGIVFGGGGSGGTNVTSTCTEEYDGTTWAGGGALTIGRRNNSSAGTQNAALAINGRSSTVGTSTISTEEYNGTAWSTGGNTSFARGSGLSSGTQNDAFINGGFFGGSNRNNTEIYDGAVWRTGASTNFYFSSYGGAGNSANDALVVSANAACVVDVTCTEQYSSIPNAVCIPSSSLGSLWLDTSKYELTLLTNINAWALGPPLITPREGTSGTNDSSYIAINAGGNTTSPTVVTSCTEEFDGSTWATGGAMLSTRFCHRILGTQNVALSIGGLTNAPTLATSFNTMEYDGSIWSTGGNLITCRYSLGAAGTQNAAVIAGGANITAYISGSAGVEEYDGTAWSSANAMATDRFSPSAAGTQNAAIFANGTTLQSTPFTTTTTAQTYDGTTWSNVASTNVSKTNGSAFGTQNNARTTIGTGAGGVATVTCLNEIYDGYIWSTSNPNTGGTGTLRGQTGGGPASSGLIISPSRNTELLITLSSFYSTPTIASTGSV